MGLKGETNSGTTGSWAWSRGEPDSGYIGRWAWVISRWDWTVSSSDPIVFCILSPLRHWCHLKDRSQRPPFVTVKFQFCAGWLRLFLYVKCLRFVSTKFRIWRLESSSLEKNLVNWFEKISVCVTDTHFKLWHKMPFYLSSPWMSELYWILSKSFHSICRAFHHKGKQAAPPAVKMNTTPADHEFRRELALLQAFECATQQIHSLKLKPWTFELLLIAFWDLVSLLLGFLFHRITVRTDSVSLSW